jgi:hypothetical protein
MHAVTTATTRRAMPGSPARQLPLRSVIRQALRDYNIAPSRIGRDALNDPKFVFTYLAGEREPRPKTEAKVRAFLAALGGAR